MNTKNTPNTFPTLKTALILSGLLAFSVSTSLSAEVISSIEAEDIKEPTNTYNRDSPTVLNITLNTVINNGACIVGDYSGCTLNDVLNDTNGNDDYKPEVKVHMIADDFPDDGLTTNATLRLRGLISRVDAQKSFRIKLDSKKKLWRNERRIQLVKSMWDFTRVRNKLSFDLFSEIPHLPSMRTQFVDLKIKNQGTTEDYGLFTHIEHFGKEYLKRRGWDKDSRIYKVGFTDLSTSSKLALNAMGEPLNLENFEKLYEIKRGKTHFDLLNMLDDLNDPSKDFNTEIMGKYFNRDNYLTWFAVNILVNNTDTTDHNFYLYNPKSTQHFYLIPWDYDYAFGQVFENYTDTTVPEAQLPRWWFTHGNWWWIKLHRRFLSQPGNLKLLKGAVEEIKAKYLTSANIQAKADSYRDVVFPVLRQSPDWDHLYLNGSTDPEQVAEFNRLINRFSKNVEYNYTKFIERIYDPMPFHMDDPTFLSNHDILFQWAKSESLTGQVIAYDLEVATTKEFKAGTVVEKVTGITDTRTTIHWTHAKGDYYYRIRSRDIAHPTQYWQDADNDDNLVYDNSDNMPIFGVSPMFVAVDGDTTTPPPSTNIVSNPVSTMTVDGDNSDWNGLTLFADDPDDVPTGVTNIVDWKNAGIAHNSTDVFFMYNNRGAFNLSNTTGKYIDWGWQAFIDTDKNASTGFQYGNALGADYFVSGNELYKYNGSGSDWNWIALVDANSRYLNNIEEFSFSRSLIGSPDSIRIIFDGRNTPFGGSTSDVYPDGALNPSASTRYFEYSFSGVVAPANNAPVAEFQNLIIAENGKETIELGATDADNDPLSLEIVQKPTHGALNYSSTSLFVEYTPDNNFTGQDFFTFKVSDGKDNSNIATVNLQINAKPSTSVISNHIVNGGITIDGIGSDWNNLTMFATDPDDIPTGSTNVINWLNAGIAHSKNKVYLIYKNRGMINANSASGDHLPWSWQTFIDIDSNKATGFDQFSNFGADYLIEGRHIYKYSGTNGSWDWFEIGLASIRYKNDIAELSFPRDLLSGNSLIKLAFLGNNKAFGSNTKDRYPDTGSFTYNLGPGQFGRSIAVSDQQSGIVKSNVSHNSLIEEITSSIKQNTKGGSFHWVFLFASLLILRRRITS